MKLLEISPANPVAREIARWARKYLHRYRGFSYNFRRGGEQRVLKVLRNFHFKQVFDVGAFQGGWSQVAFLYFPFARFDLFEISRKNFLLLKENSANAGFHLHNLGLSDRSGRVSYRDYGRGYALNTLVEKARFHDSYLPSQIRQARVETGDRFCKMHRIPKVDFLKIDAEGAEHCVLKGFKEMLRRRALRVIQFEYGYINGDAGFLMKDFYNFFDTFGYRVAPIRNRRMEFRPFEYAMNDFDSGPNFLAVHKNDREVLQALACP